MAATAGSVASSHASDWHPWGLVVVLTVLGVVSDSLPVRIGSVWVSGGFVSVVLAMALLGPAPAVLVAVTSVLVSSAQRRVSLMATIENASVFATYPLVGGLLVAALHADRLDGFVFAFSVFAGFAVSITVNILLIVASTCLEHRTRFLPRLRQIVVPILIPEALTCILTVAVAITYRWLGFAALGALVGVLFIFQLLTRELLQSQDRAQQLELRTTELATVQVGVLAALLQTLSMRDRMTARHSAAVARYARAIAEEIGLDEEEQDRVHTAGLLHDIGKFAFPDRILLADRKLDDEDWKIVKTHPYQGARLVRSIDGYSLVAEIILAHHERVDGRGYPRGLPRESIPLASRMISIADTYDVMTSRDSYRRPVSQAEAVAELRNVSGSQLDGELVEVFISVLERRSIQFQHTTDADFERELDFESRVRGYMASRAA